MRTQSRIALVFITSVAMIAVACGGGSSKPAAAPATTAIATPTCAARTATNAASAATKTACGSSAPAASGGAQRVPLVDGCTLYKDGEVTALVPASTIESTTSQINDDVGPGTNGPGLGWIRECSWRLRAPKTASSTSKPGWKSADCYYKNQKIVSSLTLRSTITRTPSDVDTFIGQVTGSQVTDVSGLAGTKYGDFAVERAFMLWQEPVRPESDNFCNGGSGSSGDLVLSLTSPRLASPDNRMLFQFIFATGDIDVQPTRDALQASLQRIAATVIARVP